MLKYEFKDRILDVYKPEARTVTVESIDSTTNIGNTVLIYQTYYDLYCCGVFNLGGMTLYQEEKKEPRKDLIKAVKADLLIRSGKCGLIRATTIATQPYMIAVLTALEFKEVSTFTNGNTKRLVTVWHLDLSAKWLQTPNQDGTFRF